MVFSLAAGGMPGSVVGAALVGTPVVGPALVGAVPPVLVEGPRDSLIDAVGFGSALDEHPVGASATTTTIGTPPTHLPSGPAEDERQRPGRLEPTAHWRRTLATTP